VVGAVALMLVGAIGGAAALSQGAGSAGAASHPLVSMAEYERPVPRSTSTTTYPK